jgi:hypothetical protein
MDRGAVVGKLPVAEMSSYKHVASIAREIEDS